ncbi:glycosyl hydrolase family 18 protein [Paenibacillus sp.]|jgi:GH18 family chitinase|uniref:glycosyl hydrolase family 18 protein n=1 Tax=Paenibacillus sp. TaxID=58172 RepID=UPI002837524D|nr:glycosyl hydrolase family 18 protein [Paenibacillus sp.]MDR0270447.1 S-layer homology domain-containing protein [Paenibacillus sp.]
MKALQGWMGWKCFVCFVCAAIITSSYAFTGQVNAGSSDTRGHWAEQLLADWRDQGLLKGYSDGSLKPNQTLTRAELMALINRYFHYTAESEATFTDLESSQWQYAEAVKALQAGYVSGNPDGAIHPNQPVTREEAAVMLAKILHADAVNDSELLRPFKDSADISPGSRQALGYLVQQGKLGGYEDGTLRPKSLLTRAEGIVLISRLPVMSVMLRGASYDKAGTYGPTVGEETVRGDAVVSASGITLQNLVIHGNLILEKGISSGKVVLKNVKVEGKLIVRASGMELAISGSTIGAVVIDGQGITLQLGSDSSISSLVLNGQTKVQGSGKIQKATINEGAKGSSFQTAPLSVDGPQAGSIGSGSPGSGSAGPGSSSGGIISGGSGGSGGDAGGSGGGAGSGGETGGGGDTTVPQAPSITGVASDKVYTSGVLPNWQDAADTTSTATLNGGAYTKGSGIIDAGEYTLVVTAVHKKSGKKASTTVKFTMNLETKLIGYVAGWKDWSQTQPVDAAKLTHINYAFTHIKGNKIISIEEQNDEANYAYLQSLKSKNANLKILNSVGGWGADGFSDAALTAESRNTFADSIIEYVEKYDLDGIDLDWEYPTQDAGGIVKGRPEDKENFTLVLKLIREKLNVLGLEKNKYYELTIAAGATQSYLKGAEISEVAKYVDNINLMTYDLAGGWMDNTDHHTNLFGRDLSVDSAVKLYLSQGVPAERLVIGAAFYGHMWTDVKSTDNHGLRQKAKGSWETPSYGTTITLYNKETGFDRYWDDVAKAPYLFNGNTFLSYDDPESLSEKAKYVLDHKLGGAMFWEYSQDNTGVLLTTLSDSLHGKTYEEDTTSVPDAPVITQVEEGGEYAPGLVPSWTDAPETASAALLNDAAYEQGTPITAAGSYTLTVIAAHGKSFKTAQTTIHFTIKEKEQPTPGPKVVAYVPGWVDWSAAKPINASKLTHINYAFTHITDNRVVPIEGQNDDANYVYLQSLKAQNPDLKILNSIGGWGLDGFSDAALTAESRNTFADSIIAYVKKYDLDGIDLDWEYPTQDAGGLVTGRPEDKENFTLVLKLIREKLDQLGAADGRYYELTIAAGATPNYLAGVEIGEVAKYVDNINLMTYDLAGGWSDKTDHHTNLFGGDLSVDSAVKLYLSQGVPAKKLVIGAAFYGHMWTDVKSTDNHGLGQKATGSSVTPTYNDIIADYTEDKGYIRYWDEDAQAPYLFDGSTFISYDDPQSVEAKAHYVLDQGLGGAMFWEYSQDATGALLGALANIILP